MNIGSLYLVRNHYWSMFPSMETASGCGRWSVAHRLDPIDTDYWSKQLNCEVTSFSPDAIIVFLEEDGKYKKVLTADGRIGWTWFDEDYNECFEEVKTEQ